MMRRYGLATLIVGLGILASHHADAATLPQRQAGLWQSNTVVTLPDGSQYRGGAPVVTVSCVDPATDLKFFTFEGSSCTNMNISGSGAQYNISGACKDQGKPESVHTELDYVDSNTVKLTGTVTSASGTLHIASMLTYQGACLSGMQPGDEGDIENGAFVKADNINDAGNQ
ncbi:MAG TPA: hypothetical protein PLT25_03800 [Acidocella sp.]|nr:hypothetical protein [Acidocella sp.]